MEPWQINNITKNLPELQSWTKCNSQLLAKLQAGNVLGEDDIQEIDCEKKPNCKAKILYDILRTRKGAYYILTKAVIETKQTGAAELLLEIPTENLSKLQILFLGNKNNLDTLLNPDQIKSIQSWLQENASLEERLQMHKSLFQQDTPLQLLLDTIPETDPFYIPRFLICRQVVNPTLFQQECPDVFVFKNADRMELRKVITSYGIEYSTCQLLQQEFTVRFLILDVEANWIKICSKVNSPVHLIRYEKEMEKFLLEETSGDSNILREYLEHNQEVEVRNISGHDSDKNDTFGSCSSLCSDSEIADPSSHESETDFGSREVKRAKYDSKSEDNVDNVGILEDRFVETIMEQNVKCIGICDLPGMGKSYLLASLARKINAEYPDRIVAFIQLQNFKPASNSSTDIPEDAQSQLLAQLATSKISQCILLELVKCKSNVKLELFFDGLDEVQENNLEPLLVFFQILVKHAPETRIFVTSRPLLQAKLEKALRVIAYDIKPFNTETQLRYLVTQWEQLTPESDVATLEAYARICLSSFGTFLKKKESNIIGIPLQCKLIADVYSKDAGLYANKNCKIPIELPHNFPSSIFEIYSNFIRRQLGDSNCNFTCIHKNNCTEELCTEECKIRNFHVHKALWCIDPFLACKFETKKCVFSDNYDDLSIHQILSPGILKKCQHAPNFEFVHRTFAEYMVAEYFCKGVLLKSSKNITKIQRAFLKHITIFADNEGFAYFLDCMITKYQKNVNMQLHCRASMSPAETEYLYLLKECIVSNYKGLIELCFKATENHKLSGKTRPVRTFRLCGYPQRRSKPALKWKNKDGKYEKLWISEYLAINLLENAAVYCCAATFDRIYMFFLEVLCIDMYDCVWLSIFEKAIQRADFDLVKYFSKKMSLENHGLLYKCLQGTYFDTIELVEKRLDIATLLLEKCPSLLTETYIDNMSCKYATPIHAWKIHLEVLKFLVQKGCDILVPNCEGDSIVYSAGKYMSDDNFFELCRFICFECKARDYFLDPASWVEYVSDFTHCAGKHPTKSLFRILCNLELETVFFQNNPFLSTHKIYEKHKKVFVSLMYSAFRERKLDFMFRESNVSFAVSSKGKTILHMAARTRDCNFFHAILCMLGELWGDTQDNNNLKVSISHRSLSEKTAPENLLELFNWHENKRLETPLHCAVRYLKDLPVETVDILLSCGNNYQDKANDFTLLDINAVNKYGNNALYYAIIGSQRLELVRRLVNRGADWTLKDIFGRSITHICAACGLVDHLKYFVELGSDVNQPDSDGNNALQCAMAHTYGYWESNVPKGKDPRLIVSEIIQVLNDAGVEKTHKNGGGKSAYDLAVYYGKYPAEILNML